MKMATAKVRLYNAKPGHRAGMCMLPGEVFIARAVVNESVCEDYAEHVQFATAVSTPFRTLLKSFRKYSQLLVI